MAQRIFVRALAAAVLLVCIGPLGCGDDDPEPPIGVVSDVLTVADSTTIEEDAYLPEPCIGLKRDPSANVYDDQCAGVTECQELPARTGGCWCAICGPKGSKIVCLQAHCATPGQ